MQLRIGNMFNSKFDLYLATTNGELNNRNALVMGAGSAKDMKLRYPGIEQQFGKLIDKQRDSKHFVYGLVVTEYEDQLLGAFQTKTNYKYSSDPGLIKQSVDMLIEWCVANPTKTVALPYPGVGYGGLKIEEVEKIIAPLPDTLTVFLSEIREGVKFVDKSGYEWIVDEKHYDHWNCYLIGNGFITTGQDQMFSNREIINYINNPQQVNQLEVA